MFVHEGAERRLTWRQPVRAEVIAASLAARYSAIQCSPGSSPSSVLHTKAAGRAPSIVVVGSPSLGTTSRNIDLVRGSIADSLAICRVSISVVVDDVAVLVDFQHERSRWSAARYGNAALCAGCPFVPDGSRGHRTDRCEPKKV